MASRFATPTQFYITRFRPACPEAGFSLSHPLFPNGSVGTGGQVLRHIHVRDHYHQRDCRALVRRHLKYFDGAYGLAGAMVFIVQGCRRQRGSVLIYVYAEGRRSEWPDAAEEEPHEPQSGARRQAIGRASPRATLGQMTPGFPKLSARRWYMPVAGANYSHGVLVPPLIQSWGRKDC